MAIALLIEILQALAVLAKEAPQAVVLVDSAVKILTVGVVTSAQEAEIRAQLDEVRAAIDAA